MPVEAVRSPPGGGSGGEEHRAEDPPQAVYLVPLYTVAIVDPNELGESGLPLNFGGEETGLDVTVEQKRQKLVTRKRSAILECDDDDPHKPTPKRLRNRMKSQKSRDKKKAYMSGLQSRVKELEKMISELEKRCHILQNENEALKNEALEIDPDVEEQLMLYYQKLHRDEETEKSVENQDDAPAKSDCSQVSFWGKCTETTGQEDNPNIDIDEVEEFAEADDLACTPEMNAHESAPLKFASTNPQQDTLRRCIKITDDNILNVEECAEQNPVTKTSSSSLKLNNRSAL